MKPSSVLLPLSLLANVALVVVFFFLRSGVPSARAVKNSTTAAPSVSAPASTSDQTTATSVSSATHRAAASSGQLWSRLYSEDPEQLIAHLKAAGFSYKEIRAIVAPMIGKKFYTAQNALRGNPESQPYWKPVSYNVENPELRAKLAALDEEESKFYIKFFSGPEALSEDEDAAESARQRWGNLSLEKLQQISRIGSDYDQLQSKLYRAVQSRLRGELTAEDRQQLALLQAERERDIKQSLTPDEFNEYLLRSSPTAFRLRNDQVGQLLHLTEAEYKALFALYRPVDEQFSQWDNDEKSRRARADAIKGFDPQLKLALGPDRYADYQLVMESSGDRVIRLMARLDLPLATVGKINAVRDDITVRAKTIRADRDLSPSDRDVRLTALSQEAEAKLTATLGGARGYAAYEDIKGDWIRELAPKPPAR